MDRRFGQLLDLIMNLLWAKYFCDYVFHFLHVSDLHHMKYSKVNRWMTFPYFYKYSCENNGRNFQHENNNDNIFCMCWSVSITPFRLKLLLNTSLSSFPFNIRSQVVNILPLVIFVNIQIKLAIMQVAFIKLFNFIFIRFWIIIIFHCQHRETLFNLLALYLVRWLIIVVLGQFHAVWIYRRTTK